MFTEAEVTSLFVAALTSFTAWVAAFPATQILPNEEIVIALAPVVNRIPTQPVKSRLSEGLLSAKPVRKLCPGGVLHWKFAVTDRGAESVTGCGFTLPDNAPSHPVNEHPPAGVAVKLTIVPAS
jgi:hypothetical protein